MQVCKSILKIDSTWSYPYLLIARVHQRKRQVSESIRSLKQCLDFPAPWGLVKLQLARLLFEHNRLSSLPTQIVQTGRSKVPVSIHLFPWVKGSPEAMLEACTRVDSSSYAPEEVRVADAAYYAEYIHMYHRLLLGGPEQPSVAPTSWEVCR
jgi:hypothetical protein